MSHPASTTLLSLPDELILKIIEHLQDERSNLINLRTTCKTLQRLVSDQHWHHLVLNWGLAVKWRRPFFEESEDVQSSCEDSIHAPKDVCSKESYQVLKSCLSKVQTIRTRISGDTIPEESCRGLLYDVATLLLPLMKNVHTVSLDDNLGDGCYDAGSDFPLGNHDRATTICAYLDNLPLSVENLELRLSLPRHQCSSCSDGRNPNDNLDDEDQHLHWCRSLGRLIPHLKVLQVRELHVCSDLFISALEEGPCTKLQELQISNICYGTQNMFYRSCDEDPVTTDTTDGLNCFIELGKQIVRRSATSPKIFQLHAWQTFDFLNGFECNSIDVTLDLVNDRTIAYPFVPTSNLQDILVYRKDQENSPAFAITYREDEQMHQILECCPWETTLSGTRMPVASMTRRERLQAKLIEANGQKVNVEDKWTYPGPKYTHQYTMCPAFLDAARIVNYDDVFDDLPVLLGMIT